nr:hypothetical protein [Tanacetum cinerariifolium]
ETPPPEEFYRFRRRRLRVRAGAECVGRDQRDGEKPRAEGGDLFRARRIGHLVRWGANNADIIAQYSNSNLASVELHFAETAQLPVVIGEQPIQVKEFLPAEYELSAPVFIPAKEVLTLSWMLPASSQLKLPVDSSYLHLLDQLRGIVRRQPVAPAAIAAITKILGGEIEGEGDKYYLIQ